jgi:hypothetical protein
MKNIPALIFSLCAFAVLPRDGCADDALPPLPQPATSFGATISDSWLYMYGGNTGKAHEFNKDCVKGDFFRLQLPGGTAWEKLPGGLALLSSSLVSYEGKVIRAGGMNARNEPGKRNELYSTDEVGAFDPAAQRWEAWPQLPEPRSSHDAVILDHTLYVGGGWTLAGDDGDGVHAHWCDTILTLDLHAPQKGWQAQPQPFQRRAIAAVTWANRIWFIGGMESPDKPSRAVDWFEPATGKWGKGPDLPDGPMAGFGTAACEQGGRLYASPLSGAVLALSPDGTKWEEVAKLSAPRFFHRLLPVTDGRLIVVGGSNHQGHITQMELISLSAKASAEVSASTPVPPSAETK